MQGVIGIRSLLAAREAGMRIAQGSPLELTGSCVCQLMSPWNSGGVSFAAQQLAPLRCSMGSFASTNPSAHTALVHAGTHCSHTHASISTPTPWWYWYWKRHHTYIIHASGMVGPCAQAEDHTLCMLSRDNSSRGVVAWAITDATEAKAAARPTREWKAATICMANRTARDGSNTTHLARLRLTGHAGGMLRTHSLAPFAQHLLTTGTRTFRPAHPKHEWHWKHRACSVCKFGVPYLWQLRDLDVVGDHHAHTTAQGHCGHGLDHDRNCHALHGSQRAADTGCHAQHAQRSA